MLEQDFGYKMDIVMCIDATGSMHPIIEDIRANAREIYGKLVSELEEANATLSEFRIKLILFRDYRIDSEPMVETKFFNLDDEVEEFYSFIDNIKIGGGGDFPENGLEALSLAINSDWNTERGRKRQVIILWTDATAHPLGMDRLIEFYPENMPKSLEELEESWNKMDRRAKRLIIFAPGDYPWLNVAEWDQTFFTEIRPGEGCGETDIDECIKMILYTWHA